MVWAAVLAAVGVVAAGINSWGGDGAGAQSSAATRSASARESSPGASTAAEGADDVVLLDVGPVGGVSPLRDQMPLSFDRDYGRYILSIGQVNRARDAACLGKPVDGVDLMPGSDELVDTFLSSMNRHQFGVPSAAEAREWGYAIPSDDPNAEQTAGEARSADDQSRLRECSDEFDRLLAASLPEEFGEGGLPAFNDFQGLLAAADGLVDEDASVARATTAWRACMRSAGFTPTGSRASMLGAPQGLAVDGADLASPATKRVSAADVECARESGVVERLVAVAVSSETQRAKDEANRLAQIRNALRDAVEVRMEVLNQFVSSR